MNVAMKMKSMLVVSLFCSGAIAEWEMKRYTSHCAVQKAGAESCVEISVISLAPLGNSKTGPCQKNTAAGPCESKDFVCGFAVGVPPQGGEDGSMKLRYYTADPKLAADFRKECDKNVASGKLTNMVRRLEARTKAE